ncbi:drebrin isoform X2 [Acanthopagrus latus]|uniref:drebrin isoform X2 n=1 Tax=Acanthopagrus latus TaxID=8177 RepID=UPI00187C4E00|nr:drebrin isoform X2 [Acanthopagrus latus]
MGTFLISSQLLNTGSFHSAAVLQTSRHIHTQRSGCLQGRNMAVNLGKNRLALLTAYQDVIDETSDTDWALYTYEDDSNDLTLASSGGGGLAEITLTFDNGRVMYGFCSLKEPNSALPRYILINWVGEDVPDARKCACASHVATIADFFQVSTTKGVEVTVNASSVDDIDPSAIGQRLTNGTAALASPVLSRLRTREEEHGEGTVYEKTNAEVEMKKINREEFWEKAKREEELRKEEEKKKAAEERQRYEEERMELERIEQENREKRYREREQQIEEHRKKLLEEEEARERLRNQSTIAAEPSIEDLNLDKKETEVEEAKAIIAQRSGNPREFFKQKERAMTISCDTSPISVHRTGRLDSPFLRQQHSPSSPSPTPPLRGESPLRTPPHSRRQPAAAAGDDDDEASIERNMAAVSPIPKIVTTPIKEDFSREDEDSRDEWDSMSKPEQKPPVQESTPSKPVQSVAPQARDSGSFNVWDAGTDSLVNLWDSSSGPPPNTSQTSNLVDLMGDSVPPSSATASGKPQPLVSFDDMVDGTFGSAAEDDPSSLVDVTASDQMTLSYQHALQHASMEGPDLDDGQLLMTNGETLLKEGTQASEGYFSQSQEDEFGQSEESSAKPAPVFYNKPPEIDITCWDTDPVVDDDDD